MPLYDYRCESGHQYEVREPFGSPAEQPCQKCGKPARRVLHARPIMFKGSGWYSTDSRGSSRVRSSPTASDDSSDAAAASDGNGKAPSKAAAKKSEKRREVSETLSKTSEPAAE